MLESSYITCWLEDEPLEDKSSGIHSDSSMSASSSAQRPRRASAVEDDDDLFQIKDSDFDSDMNARGHSRFPALYLRRTRPTGLRAMTSLRRTRRRPSRKPTNVVLSEPLRGCRQSPTSSACCISKWCVLKSDDVIMYWLICSQEFVEQQTLKEVCHQRASVDAG